MNEDDDQFFVEPQIEEVHDIKLIEEANPIFEKTVTEEPKNITLKILEPLKPQQPYVYKTFKFEHVQSSQSDDEQSPRSNYSPFTEYYSPQQCVYQKMRNQSYNKLNGVQYFSGSFLHRNTFLDNPNQTISLSQIANNYYDVSDEPLPHGTPTDLIFSSNFQSGNLFAAFKITANEYDLVMSNDTNSVGNNQWFYFSVEGMIPNKDYTFNVVNFTKSDSLFNYGMAPAVYSFAENKRADIEKGWKRMGKQVSYKKGKIQRQNSRRMYYTLSFKLSTSFDKDKLLIAHSYPYSYEKLNKYITEKITKHKDIVTRITVTKSLSKRLIEAMIITQPINKKRDNRKAVIVLARQHPGESQGSFVCEGLVEKLLSKNKQAQFLIKNYVFYIIPMVNPDGVIFGHYRTNLAGKDLNRKWNATEKEVNCPEVTGIKSFLQEVSKERDIRFILDLHGHSKKLNSFFYGNPCPQNPDVVRIFPYVCSKLNPAVQFYDCTFSTEEYKRKAARVYLSFLYRLIHVYTFESSFYSYFKDGKKIQFNPKQYRDLGGTLIMALFMQLEHEIKYQQSFEFNLKKNNTKDFNNSSFVKLVAELKNNKQLLEIGSKAESGSQSKPEQAQINNDQIEIVKIVRPLSTPNVIEQSNKTNKTSRKGVRQNRDYNFNKPIRNIKFLEMSRVNSILPDKYQLGLQPIKKKEIVSNYETVIKHPISFKVTSDCQTENKNQLMKFIDFRVNQIQACNLSNSLKLDPTIQERKFSSVIKSHNRNIIFKFDIFSQSTRNDEPKLTKPLILKNAYSQTMITYSKQHGEKLKSSQLFPQVDSPNDDKKWLKNNSIRIESSLRSGLRKQAELFFNGMVKKLLTQKQIKTNQQASNKFIMDKPLSIKKKQMSKK